MPCSQCGQLGHNKKTCFRIHNEFLGLISPDIHIESVPTKPKETRESIRIQQDKEYKEAEERDRLRNEAIATLSGPVNHKEVMTARLLFFERKFG